MYKVGVCMDVCMYAFSVCMYACMHACMHACMYIYARREILRHRHVGMGPGFDSAIQQSRKSSQPWFAGSFPDS